MKKIHIAGIAGLVVIHFYLMVMLITRIPGAPPLTGWRYDGKYISPHSIDSTKEVTDRSKVIGNAVIGNVQMYDPTYGEMWIPVDYDSGVGHVNLGAPWATGADNAPQCSLYATEPLIKTLNFDGGGGSADDTVYVYFTCPANYKDDTMELYLYWFITENGAAVTDSIRWCGRMLPLNSAATDSTIDFWDSGTALTDVAEVLTYSGPGSDATADSLLHITNLDPEVANIDPGDLIKLMLYVDESRSGLAAGSVALIGMLVRWDILDVP